MAIQHGGPVLPLEPVRERLRPGTHHCRYPHRRGPVAVVPPDPVASREVVGRRAHGRLDAVDVEEPVAPPAAALCPREAVDGLNEAAAVARVDLGIPVKHVEDGVRLVDRVVLLHEDVAAVVAAHRQRDVALVLPGPEPAAGGRHGAERRDDRQVAGCDHFLPFPLCLCLRCLLPPRLRCSQFFASLSRLSALTESVPPPQLTRSLPPPRKSIRSFPASARTPSLPARGLI